MRLTNNQSMRFMLIAFIVSMMTAFLDMASFIGDRPYSIRTFCTLMVSITTLWSGTTVLSALILTIARIRLSLFYGACIPFVLFAVTHTIQHRDSIGKETEIILMALIISIFIIKKTRKLSDILGSLRFWGIMAVFTAIVPFIIWYKADTLIYHKDRSDMPNIILISVDTLRADRLGVYGNPDKLTPNIDSLAEISVLFEHTTAPMPITGPSHVTMLTGLHPVDSGVRRNGVALQKHIETLPVILAKKGYKTAGFISGYPLTDESISLARQFHFYDDNLSRWNFIPREVLRRPLGSFFAGILKRFGLNLLRFERPGAETTDRVLEWLNDNYSNPFFLFIHYYDPHSPYQPAVSYEKLSAEYKGEVVGKWDGKSVEWKYERIRDDRDIERFQLLYDGEVISVDAEIGRILGNLERLGIMKNTMIIFTSDHGESLGEHNIYFDHISVYNAELHVPLIIRFPSDKWAKRRVEGQTEIIDLSATVLDVLDMNETLPGSSLISSIEAGPNRGRVIFAATQYFSEFGYVSYAVSDGRYKLIWKSPYWFENILLPENEEIYDLINDPFEEQNIVNEHQSSFDILRNAMNAWRTRNQSEAEKSVIKKDVMNQLKSLGYLQ